MESPGTTQPPSGRAEALQAATDGKPEGPIRPRPPTNTAALLYLAVGLGSAFGGTARWLLSDGLLSPVGTGFPWGTLFVNVTGSFLIGLYAALARPGGGLISGPIQRHFFMTGVFGGYTTFSIFSLESIQLVEQGLFAAAGLNVAVSLGSWLLAVAAGFLVGRKISDSAQRSIHGSGD